MRSGAAAEVRGRPDDEGTMPRVAIATALQPVPEKTIPRADKPVDASAGNNGPNAAVERVVAVTSKSATDGGEGKAMETRRQELVVLRQKDDSVDQSEAMPALGP